MLGHAITTIPLALWLIFDFNFTIDLLFRIIAG